MKNLIYKIWVITVFVTLPLTFSQAKNCVKGNTGLKGKTIYRVYSGVPGGKTTDRIYSTEFAIAPVEGNSPVYRKAIFVKSDEQGKFEVTLPPGRYWIGPRTKALDPNNFESSVKESVMVSEKIVVVKEGVFTHVEVLQEDYAP